MSADLDSIQAEVIELSELFERAPECNQQAATLFAKISSELVQVSELTSLVVTGRASDALTAEEILRYNTTTESLLSSINNNLVEIRKLLTE